MSGAGERMEGSDRPRRIAGPTGDRRDAERSGGRDEAAGTDRSAGGPTGTRSSRPATRRVPPRRSPSRQPWTVLPPTEGRAGRVMIAATEGGSPPESS